MRTFITDSLGNIWCSEWLQSRVFRPVLVDERRHERGRAQSSSLVMVPTVNRLWYRYHNQSARTASIIWVSWARRIPSNSSCPVLSVHAALAKALALACLSSTMLLLYSIGWKVTRTSAPQREELQAHFFVFSLVSEYKNSLARSVFQRDLAQNP